VRRDGERTWVCGVGLDLVTIPDHYWEVGSLEIMRLGGHAADALDACARDDPPGMFLALARLVYRIACSATLIAEDEISFSGLQIGRDALLARPRTQPRLTRREFSFAAEVPELTIFGDADCSARVERLARAIQEAFDLISQDGPRAAIGHLARELSELSLALRPDDPVSVHGQGVEGSGQVHGERGDEN
jgi:hypothetical protein